MASYCDQSIDDLMKTLSSSTLPELAPPRASAILQAKSMIESANAVRDLSKNIVSQSKNVNERIDELKRTLEAMINSGNKMYKATIAFSIIMAILTCVIAFSALIQAGIIKF